MDGYDESGSAASGSNRYQEMHGIASMDDGMDSPWKRWPRRLAVYWR